MQTDLQQCQYNRARLNERHLFLAWAKDGMVTQRAEAIGEDPSAIQKEDLVEKVDGQIHRGMAFVAKMADEILNLMELTSVS